MIRCGVKAIYFLTALFVVSGFALADDRTVNMESKIIQNFDSPEEQKWFLMGSKFSSKGYPKIAFVKNTWPSSLYGVSPAEPDKLSTLGVAMMFDRKEYNWVDIVPGQKTVDSEGKTQISPKELPLVGRVSSLDVWVWGSGFNYYMEAYVRDYRGIVHTINMGMISHEGWKNLRISIPDNIPQSKPTLPKRQGMSFVKFRIWTTPAEAVAVIGDEDTLDSKTTAKTDQELPVSKAIFVYIDQIKILTDTYETMYDGDVLADPENVKKNWGSEGK